MAAFIDEPDKFRKILRNDILGYRRAYDFVGGNTEHIYKGPIAIKHKSFGGQIRHPDRQLFNNVTINMIFFVANRDIISI